MFSKVWIRRLLARVFHLIERQVAYHHYLQAKQSGVLTVGRHTYGMPTIEVYRGSEAKVIIGNFCSIAPRVTILTGGIHAHNWVSTYPFRVKWRLAGAYHDGMPMTKGDVQIGSDVWLGSEVMILSGVTIGHGAIIGARALVTEDIPPYAIAVGIPAQVIRYRFAPEKIEELLTLKWWEWDDARILQAVPLLSSTDIDAFLQMNGPGM